MDRGYGNYSNYDENIWDDDFSKKKF